MKILSLFLTAVFLVVMSLVALAQEMPKHHDISAQKKTEAKVICFLCDDITMDKSEAVEMTFKGKKVYLCSVSEKEPFEKEPTKWVYATDPVTGKKVDKTATKYTYDQPVKYVNKKGIERKNKKRYFFESRNNMSEFKAHAEKYVVGKYSPITEAELSQKAN